MSQPEEKPSYFSDEELNNVVKAYLEHGQNKQAAARSLKLAETSYRRRLNAASERGMLIGKTQPAMPGFVVTSISEKRDADGKLEHSHIRQAPDPGERKDFQLPQGHIAKGVSALVDAEGKIIQQWVKTREDTQHLVEAIKEAFKDAISPVPLIDPPRLTDADLLSVYPIADQHNGLLAWGKETGEPYDLKIGEERLRSCASRLISQSPRSRQAIILNLGDWQHTDDQKNQTPAHHNILDVDSRYRKILVAGVKLMKDVVELTLQRHQSVLVVNIPGNHDPHASIALDVALIEAYANNPRVDVWGSPAEFFFHRFGNTLLGATHGYRCKPQEMAMTMAVRAREDWGKTAFHHFMYGHIHHESVKEIGDVRVESFQTLAANDAHHEASGYTSGKSLTSITYHRQDGEIGRHRVNVPAPPRKVSQFIELKEAA